MLPGLRKVDIVMAFSFAFLGPPKNNIEPERAESLIKFALDILSPFQDSKAEVLRIIKRDGKARW